MKFLKRYEKGLTNIVYDLYSRGVKKKPPHLQHQKIAQKIGDSEVYFIKKRLQASNSLKQLIWRKRKGLELRSKRECISLACNLWRNCETMIHGFNHLESNATRPLCNFNHEQKISFQTIDKNIYLNKRQYCKHC